MATDLKFESEFLEAPASWNVRLISPEGFFCMLTLRGNGGMELLERTNAAIAYLVNHGYKPDDRKNNNHHSTGDTQICPIHKCEMRRYEKDGRSWYSHRLDNGSWCRGKQNKNGGNHE